MAIKRKLDFDEEPVNIFTDRPAKHARVQTNHVEPPSNCEDIAMDDTASESCSASTPSANESPVYPEFKLYPFPTYESNDVEMDLVTPSLTMATVDSRTSSNASEESAPVGLLQPKNSFIHNNSTCVQIPRLRVACEAGLGGTRTLWTQCDECGAIEMIGDY